MTEPENPEEFLYRTVIEKSGDRPRIGIILAVGNRTGYPFVQWEGSRDPAPSNWENIEPFRESLESEIKKTVQKVELALLRLRLEID